MSDDTILGVYERWGKANANTPAFGYPYRGEIRRVWAINRRQYGRFFELVLGGVAEPVRAEGEFVLSHITPPREPREYSIADRLDDHDSF